MSLDASEGVGRSDVWDHSDARGLADKLEKVLRRENPWTVARASWPASLPIRPRAVEGGFKIYEWGA